MPSLSDVFGTDLASRPEDMSVDFLSNIFGPSFYSMADFVPAGAVKVMFDLFGALNSFALVILVFTTIFFTASAVVGTAHEGKVLGDKLHSFWVPVRLIGAAAFLVPVKHGLCLFQVLLLLTIGVSIQCANKLFDIYLTSTYEQTIASPLPISKLQVAQEIVDSAISNLTYFREFYGDVDTNSKTDWKTSNGQFVDEGYTDSASMMRQNISALNFPNPRNDPSWFSINGYSDLMGSIKLDCGYTANGPTPYTELCFRQGDPVTHAIDRVQNEIIPPFAAYARGESVDASVSAKAYDDIVHELAKGLQDVALVMHDNQYKEMVAFTEGKMQLFSKLGWASAGSVYHTLSNVQAELVRTLHTPIAVKKGNHWTNEKFQLNKAEYERYKRQVLSVIESYKLPQAFKEGENSTLEDYFKKAGWNSKKVIEFIQGIAKADNTMIEFSGLGHLILDVVFGFYVVVLGIALLSPGIATTLSSLSLTFTAPMIVSGALLAYYVPAIPFLIWTAGIIGWFIVVIEALVAAPLWVLGISRVDGGEGFFGSAGQSGLYLFLSVLTRPFGMLLGLCVAMTVMTFVDKLLIGLFNLFVVDTDTTQDFFEVPLVSLIAYIFILSATRTTFVHKIFGLVSYLPDVMVNWIGHSGQSLRDSQDEEKVSHVVDRSTGHLALAGHSSNHIISGVASLRAGKGKGGAQNDVNTNEANNAQKTTHNAGQSGANAQQSCANQNSSRAGKDDRV